MNTQIKRIDQIARLEADLRNNPLSRRHVVSAWHPGLLPNTSLTPAENAAVGKQALPPCHTLFQFMCEPMTLVERLDWARNNIGVAVIEIDEVDVSSMHEEHELADWAHAHFDTANVPRYFLSCQLYQRSADLFLGVPFNIMSYALLTHMLAHTHNMAAREFVHTLGDAHIYSNHVEQVKKQLGRKPKKLPTVRFNADKTFASVTDFTSDDIHIEGYTSHAAIKGKVAV
jgi:thymidylate synthase